MPSITGRTAVSSLGIKMQPYLRWIGGKRQIVKYLLDALPPDIHERTYVEPFVGAGSLFFALGPKHAVLSDANEHLMQAHRYVRDKPELVSSYLRHHLSETSETYYYQIRELYNTSGSSAAQAARFIYLNKSCFNGIFRVNLRGHFNVPYGHKDPPFLPSAKDLREASRVLKKAKLQTQSYEYAMDNCGRGHFVYMDPPYPPLNGTSYFTHYTSDRFADSEQAKVLESAVAADRSGAKVMITNADTPTIRKLYRRFHIRSVSVIRYVTCKAKKHQVKELIITNY